jgi:RNA-binding protein
MLTSKERAELRSRATTLDTTLMIGKGGITDAVIAEAENQLDSRELVKGKVLEGAMMTPREVCDEICEATGAEGVGVIGTKFIIYRFSEKLQAERNQVGRAKRKEIPAGKANPVRKGAQARRQAAKKVREQRNEYFRQMAIDKAIEREREKKLREQER